MALKKRRLIIGALIIAALTGGCIVGAPVAGRWYIGKRLTSLGKRLSRTVTADEISVDRDRVVLERVRISGPADPGGRPLASIARITIEYRLRSLFSGRLDARKVVVEGPRVSLLRKKDGTSNFLDLLKRPSKSARGGGGKGKLKLGEIVVVSGAVQLEDRLEGMKLMSGSVDGTLRVAGGRSRLEFGSVQLVSGGLSDPVTFTRLDVSVPGLDRQDLLKPRVGLRGGSLKLLPGLRLTGVRGTVRLDSRSRRISIDLEGSYGGADARLWSASGWMARDFKKGKMKMKAARFSLGRIASILSKTPIIHPLRTLVDGHLELTLDSSVVGFDGKLEVNRLCLFHPSLARTPVLDLTGKVQLGGKVDLAKRELTLKSMRLRSRGMEVLLSGTVSRLSAVPRVSLVLEVPRIPCRTVLRAFPPSLLPRLQGFTLKGDFHTRLTTSIDFGALSGLALGGKVGINKCKVTMAPEASSAQRLEADFSHRVEPSPGSELAFVVGPENEDFVPYANISKNVINAFLTTEDAGFFRHRGFIPSMFRKALSRNLKSGGFRLGASTISMQMVKNVLLSHEKTISRKIQELFLTWYLEKNLTKERIIEIYLNVIEFGPSIYGIGTAARHYFGKDASEITPLEASFFASILPSPKRRYFHYCNGKLSDKWDRYVRRILRRMASKGFVDQTAMTAAADQKIVFNRDFDELSEKDCNKQRKDLLESWHKEYLQRLRAAVVSVAPHQVEMYLGTSSTK